MRVDADKGRLLSSQGFILRSLFPWPLDALDIVPFLAISVFIISRGLSACVERLPSSELAISDKPLSSPNIRK
jgi:hypothetical protein